MRVQNWADTLVMLSSSQTVGENLLPACEKVLIPKTCPNSDPIPRAHSRGEQGREEASPYSLLSNFKKWKDLSKSFANSPIN